MISPVERSAIWIEMPFSFVGGRSAAFCRATFSGSGFAAGAFAESDAAARNATRHAVSFAPRPGFRNTSKLKSRFDEASKVFEVSARELAEDEGFRRVGFDRGDGWRRLGLGSEIHSRVLAARRDALPGYRAEVHLQARVPVEGWTAILTGRLDGCVERAAGEWLIEELKSTDRSVEGVRPSG